MDAIDSPEGAPDALFYRDEDIAILGPAQEPQSPNTFPASNMTANEASSRDETDTNTTPAQDPPSPLTQLLNFIEMVEQHRLNINIATTTAAEPETMDWVDSSASDGVPFRTESETALPAAHRPRSVITISDDDTSNTTSAEPEIMDSVESLASDDDSFSPGSETTTAPGAHRPRSAMTLPDHDTAIATATECVESEMMDSLDSLVSEDDPFLPDKDASMTAASFAAAHRSRSPTTLHYYNTATATESAELEIVDSVESSASDDDPFRPETDTTTTAASFTTASFTTASFTAAP
ncbi:hypothetical protein QBC37DRAFT_374039 [Rhypophila decipiens]|uniref:Uncharacterized protein n=1 Tax=Rhypophila decipiens TaxID=261697 RepID=A0AAN6YC85_9PEZI|nr:hypothetical protein QBC37DRAFT_374039 [Rhypophila decipiens]